MLVYSGSKIACDKKLFASWLKIRLMALSLVFMNFSDVILPFIRNHSIIFLNT